jgi:hypothetical protein
MIDALLLLIALIFAGIELIRARGQSLLGWAVFLICVVLAPWEALLR